MSNDQEEPSDEFLGIAPTQPVTHKRSSKLHTWVGSGDRLVAIQQALLVDLRTAYDIALAKEPEKPPEDTSGAVSWEYHRRALRESFELETVVRGRGNRWDRRGDLAVMFTDTDLEEVESVTMRTKPRRLEVTTTVEVSLKRATGQFADAVEVQVEGPDRTWVDGVHTNIVDMLRKNLPKWSILRSFWLSWAALSVPTIVVVVLLQRALFGPDVTRDEVPGLVVVSLAECLVYAISLLLVMTGLHRMLPGFEVTPGDGQSLGGKRLAVLWAIFAFVVGSLVVPILLKALDLA